MNKMFVYIYVIVKKNVVDIYYNNLEFSEIS